MTNKKFQKKSVKRFGSMITSKNVNPFTGAKQIKTLSGSFVTNNPKTSGERASQSKRYTDKYKLNKTSDTEIEIARKKRKQKEIEEAQKETLKRNQRREQNRKMKEYQKSLAKKNALRKKKEKK